MVPFSTFQNWSFPIHPERSLPLKRLIVFCADREVRPRKEAITQDERAFLYFIKYKVREYILKGAVCMQTGKSLWRKFRIRR
jgi:hypothetical protein